MLMSFLRATQKELLADKAQTEKQAAEAKKWIQQGMKEDAEKHNQQK